MSANPLLSETSPEAARLKRVLDGIKAYVRKPQNIVFKAMLNDTDNVVLYEYDPSEEAEGDGVACYWLKLEPADAAYQRSIGNASLRVPLNPAEELLYGFKLDVLDSGEFIVSVRSDPRGSRHNLVMNAKGDPMVIGKVADKKCVLEYAYVYKQAGFIPSVDYVNFYGREVGNPRVWHKDTVKP
jgi:hypothetical protein